MNSLPRTSSPSILVDFPNSFTAAYFVHHQLSRMVHS